MADEQATAETTATDQEIEQQTSVFADNDSEVEKNSFSEADRGDLRVPLKEERQRRQELESKWNDPNEIVTRARELGIVDEPDPLEQPQYQSESQSDVQQVVKTQIEIEKAYEKYPELKSDDELRYMVAGLINRGMSPLKAADKAHEKMQKIAEGIKQREQEEAKRTAEAQNNARSVEGTSTKTSADAEIESLVARSKNRSNPRDAEKALIELTARKLR